MATSRSESALSLRKDRPFRRVLVANRGEIAVRIIRACRDLGVETVSVYSDADVSSTHVRLADASVRVGPPPPSESYLRIDAVVDAALATGAEAIHPGYGFLAERAAFARAVEDAGLVFVGASSVALDARGGKLHARRLAGRVLVGLSSEAIEALGTKLRPLRLGAEADVPAVPGTLEPAPVDRPDDVE